MHTLLPYQTFLLTSKIFFLPPPNMAADTNSNGSRKLNATTPVRFVNTSMHGVSDLYVKRAFDIFGFASYVPVKEQQEPNPDFPTVKFPNPEEKGALVNSLAYVFSLST